MDPYFSTEDHSQFDSVPVTRVGLQKPFPCPLQFFFGLPSLYNISDIFDISVTRCLLILAAPVVAYRYHSTVGQYLYEGVKTKFQQLHVSRLAYCKPVVHNILYNIVFYNVVHYSLMSFILTGSKRS